MTAPISTRALVRDVKKLNALQSAADDKFYGSDFAGALPMLKKCADVYEAAGTTDQENYVFLLHKQADCQSELMEYDEAITLSERAEAAYRAREVSHKSYDLDSYASVIGNLGFLYREQGRYTEALGAYERCLVLQKKAGDPARIAAQLNNIAEIQKDQGKEELGLETIAQAESLLVSSATGKVPSRFADVYYLVCETRGNLLKRLRRYREAVDAFRLAVSYNMQVYGARSVQMAGTLINLALVQQESGDLEGALLTAKQSADMFESLRGRHTLDFAHCAHLLGELHSQLGKYREALRWLNESLGISRALLPQDHPRLANTLRSIAVASELSGADGPTVESLISQSIFVSRRSQTQCGAAGCDRKVKADGSPLDQCGGCKRTHYCSPGCQRADWKAGHKTECAELQAGKA